MGCLKFKQPYLLPECGPGMGCSTYKQQVVEVKVPWCRLARCFPQAAASLRLASRCYTMLALGFVP